MTVLTFMGPPYRRSESRESALGMSARVNTADSETFSRVGLGLDVRRC